MWAETIERPASERVRATSARRPGLSRPEASTTVAVSEASLSKVTVGVMSKAALRPRSAGGGGAAGPGRRAAEAAAGPEPGGAARLARPRPPAGGAPQPPPQPVERPRVLRAIGL